MILRSSGLGIIRRNAPLVETLFTPQWKLNLEVFVKDQEFFHQIALALMPLREKGEVDSEMIEEHFRDSSLLQTWKEKDYKQLVEKMPRSKL